jgi:hypothetical protein
MTSLEDNDPAKQHHSPAGETETIDVPVRWLIEWDSAAEQVNVIARALPADEHDEPAYAAYITPAVGFTWTDCLCIPRNVRVRAQLKLDCFTVEYTLMDDSTFHIPPSRCVTRLEFIHWLQEFFGDVMSGYSTCPKGVGITLHRQPTPYETWMVAWRIPLSEALALYHTVSTLTHKDPS